MNSEDRKIYNKTYYDKNKKEVLLKLSKKICCPNCNKELTNGRLKGHLKTSICTRNAIIKPKDNMLLMMDEIKLLQIELLNLKEKNNI